MSTKASIPVTVKVGQEDTEFSILIQLPPIISWKDVNLLYQAVQELDSKERHSAKFFETRKIADQHLVIDIKNWRWDLFKRGRFDAFVKAIAVNSLHVEAVRVDSLSTNLAEYLSAVNFDKWLSTSQGVACITAWCEGCGWTEEMAIVGHQESDLRNAGKMLIQYHTHENEHCEYPLQFEECY